MYTGVAIVSAIVAKYGEILTRLECSLYISYKSGLCVYAIILNIDHTRNIADLVKFKSMVLIYKIYNNLMPSNILSNLCMVHMSHAHDTRQAGHFKNMYCRTTLKSMCLSVRGPVIWNKLHIALKNSSNVNMFKKSIQYCWLVSML